MQRQNAIRLVPPPTLPPARPRLVRGFQAPIIRTSLAENTWDPPSRPGARKPSVAASRGSPAHCQSPVARHAGAVREMARLVTSMSASPRRYLVIRKRSNSLCEKTPVAGAFPS